MATEKTLNTRILLKYDTLANWNASTFLLKKGEVAFVEVPTVEGSTLQPVMFKVGTGDKKFSELDWVSAKAADVHGWAKKSQADFETYVKSLVNTDLLKDYYTKTEIDALLKAITDAASALAGRVATAEGKITALEEKYDVDKKLSVVVSEIEGKISAVDTGVMTVTGKDAIAVTAGVNPEISLTIDPTSGNVVLTQTATGLKAEIDLSDYALADNIPTEDEIKASALAAVEALIKSSDDTNAEVVIENVNALVDYVNKNAGDIAQLVTDVATANTNASEAVETANTAASDAATAKSDAATAKSDAAAAVQTANEAKTGAENSAAAAAASASAAAGSATEASSAKDAAVAAQNAATTAKNDAEKAKSDAQEILDNVTDAATGAQATANQAVETANSANTTAGEAKTAAVEAVSTANAAKAAADTAVQSVVAGDGLTASKTGTEVTIGFDDSVVFVFDCGNASTQINN